MMIHLCVYHRWFVDPQLYNILLHATTRAFYRPVEINEKNPSLHSNPCYDVQMQFVVLERRRKKMQRFKNGKK